MEAEGEVLKFEAERRLGQLMQARVRPSAQQGGGDQRSDHRVFKKLGGPPTLADAGINKNTAHRARQAAALSPTEFEKAAEAKREKVRTRSKKTKTI
jgi:hypothetical protein